MTTLLSPTATPGTGVAPAPDRRRLALYVLCTGVLMIVLDVTIVNVALPSIQHDLRFSAGGLAWVVNAYLISFGGLLLLAGRLGDLIGGRRIFLTGIALFTTASVGCGLADDAAVLVVGRFVQGVGGALTSAVVLGMIVTMFPEPGEQARAIGIYAFVASAGSAVGLLAGGVLTQTLSWHWIFFVNVPVGLATAIAARRLLPTDRSVSSVRGIDHLGAALATGTMMVGVWTIVDPAAAHGWVDTRTLVPAALTVLGAVGFVLRERVAASPLVPLRIFRSRCITGANIVQVLSVAGMFGVFFLGALYLQQVLHYDALQLGLAFLPVCVIMGTLSVRATGPLIARFGGVRLLVAGMALMTAALALFARAPLGGSYVVDVLPVMVLLGTGAGLAFPALMTVAMSDAAPQDAGLASGLVNTTAQVGAAFGLAVLATVAAARTATLRSEGVATAAAQVGGYHLAFLVAAGLMALSGTVAGLLLRRS